VFPTTVPVPLQQILQVDDNHHLVSLCHPCLGRFSDPLATWVSAKRRHMKGKLQLRNHSECLSVSTSKTEMLNITRLYVWHYAYRSILESRAPTLRLVRKLSKSSKRRYLIPRVRTLTRCRLGLAPALHRSNCTILPPPVLLSSQLS
jgi:hypothetical protein